jgi:hypothetical protein
MEPRPFSVQKPEQNMMVFSVSSGGLQLQGSSLRLRVETEWTDATRSWSSREEFAWEGGLIQTVRVKAFENLRGFMRIELLDHDQYPLAWLETALDSNATVTDLQLQATSDAQRNWDQEFRVFITTSAAVKPVEDPGDQLSFKDVRDIFHRHNCVVCHRQPKAWDLRTFPFRIQDETLETKGEHLQKIMRQIREDRMPPLPFSRITDAEKLRLEAWAAAGFPEDRASPLKAPNSPMFDGTVKLAYQIPGSSRLRGELLLVPDTLDRSFKTRIKLLPFGARIDASLQVFDRSGKLLHEQRVETFRLKDESLKVIALRLKA